MSISMYSRQVDSLTTEIATLRKKSADERQRAAAATAKALKAVDSLNRATSASQARSRARDVERHQKDAADREKKVADLEGRIAQKQRNLTSATDKLDRARRDQAKKDAKEAEKQRKAEIDHVKRLERERRSAAVMPHNLSARPPVVAGLGEADGDREAFDVCLSFAGEQRDYVERIAAELKAAGLRVFYDQDEDIAASIWGKDLGEYLDYIYREGARFCLMFISADYASKAWTRHERRSALARALTDDGDYLLPARFDDTELPGLRPTTAYLDLREVAPATLVEYVIKRLAHVTQSAAEIA